MTVVATRTLHARPAAALALVLRGNGPVRIENLTRHRSGDARSILGILSAGVRCGDEVLVIGSGEDAVRAAIGGS
jgi:phosphotransferase system HPr (HPr) family protein